jgi:Fic family protein
MKIPQTPPDFMSLLNAQRSAEDITRIFGSSRPVDHKGRYLHWDELRSRPAPDGLTHQEWWLGTVMARRAIAKWLPLMDRNGKPFRFSNVDSVQERVHRVDQRASGHILADDVVTSLRSSDRYLVSSLAEEAITSSQLEGASTTRQAAKEMLATGRKPRDRSEHMIFNNYRAMLYAQELVGNELSSDAVLELHRIVTEDTLDDPADAGRLQTSDDERIAVFWHDGTLLHQPPSAAELPERLEALCGFANGQTPDGFVHPVVRALIVHFWLAYDHPFADGNGRTARALFYWAMLTNGYWLAQYLSVSSILRKAPAQYAKSFLYAETDDNDLTYFLLYNLNVIERSIASLHEYLGRKMAEAKELQQLLRGSGVLNRRQSDVVAQALRDSAEPFTIAAQARRNGVTYQSARTDLLALEDLGLFDKVKIGKKFVFFAKADLTARLRRLGTSVIPAADGGTGGGRGTH